MIPKVHVWNFTPQCNCARSGDFKKCVDQISSLINRSVLFVEVGLLESLLLLISEERERWPLQMWPHDLGLPSLQSREPDKFQHCKITQPTELC